MPKLYIISGCNGAGKTTASYSVLPDMLDCKEFVNADEIAKGLSPFRPEKVGWAVPTNPYAMCWAGQPVEKRGQAPRKG